MSNPNKQYISAGAQGVVDANAEEVIISFYGPRGGTRAIVSLSANQAEMLSLKLAKAVREINKEALS